MHPVKTITDISDGVQNEANTPKISLLPKKFGLFDGAAHIIGVVIGSGIFISPVVVLKNCGSPGMSLVIWAVAGIIRYVYLYLLLLITWNKRTYDNDDNYTLFFVSLVSLDRFALLSWQL